LWLWDRFLNPKPRALRVQLISILDKGANTEAARNTGATALYISACHGHLGVVKLLLEKGAMLQARTNKSETAADVVAENGHKAIVELLTSSLNPLK